MSKDEFFEEQNLSSLFAILQYQYCKDFNKDSQDIRPGTYLYYDLLILAYAILFLVEYSRYVLSQLSLSQADDYGIYNVWCENYNVIPNAGTKTLIKTTCTFTKPVKLYKTLPEDNINNYLAQVQDQDGHIFVIHTTSEFNAGTYNNVIFESVETGKIQPTDGSELSIVNPINGWGVNGGSAGNLQIISLGDDPDNIDDIKTLIEQTTPMHNPKNLYQGLVKDLINNGCKNAVWYKSTNFNNLYEKGLPTGKTLILVQTGNQETIFNILEQYMLGVDLYGNIEKIINYYGVPYYLAFSYAQQQKYYIKMSLNPLSVIIQDREQFKLKMKQYILETLKSQATLSTTSLNMGIVFSIAQTYLSSTNNTEIMIEDLQLSLDGENYTNIISIAELGTYLYPFSTDDIEITFTDED